LIHHHNLTMVDAPRNKKERIRRRAGDELYQISWDHFGNPVATTTTQQQQIPEDDSPLFLATQQQQQFPQGMIVDPQLQQLSFSDINPIPTTVWSYTVFLGSCLGFWLLYLLLPRGCRKQYCLAQRKRYPRNTDRNMPPAGYWVPVNRAKSDVMSTTSTTQSNKYTPRGVLPSNSTMSSIGGPSTPPRGSGGVDQNDNRRRGSNPPSPEHPAIRKIPPNRVIAETMARLQGRGIRLVAHGVHCDPKRVWIKLDDDDTTSVVWQTEVPRRVPNQSGQVSIVMMRGSSHRIGLANVLYIDVGKKTNALQRLNMELAPPEQCCFSLLTQNGSLDLQANSKLERDALVSCFSMILDDVHSEDWRALYEASPDTSLANSTVNHNGQGTEVAYQPSDFMVEI
jgi:hypothetical protein